MVNEKLIGMNIGNSVRDSVRDLIYINVRISVSDLQYLSTAIHLHASTRISLWLSVNNIVWESKADKIEEECLDLLTQTKIQF